MNALRNYALLNYTAVIKILKKHDKYLPFKIGPEFLKENVSHLPAFGNLEQLTSTMNRVKVRGYFLKLNN